MLKSANNLDIAWKGSLHSHLNETKTRFEYRPLELFQAIGARYHRESFFYFTRQANPSTMLSNCTTGCLSSLPRGQDFSFRLALSTWTRTWTVAESFPPGSGISNHLPFFLSCVSLLWERESVQKSKVWFLYVILSFLCSAVTQGIPFFGWFKESSPCLVLILRPTTGQESI